MIIIWTENSKQEILFSWLFSFLFCFIFNCCHPNCNDIHFSCRHYRHDNKILGQKKARKGRLTAKSLICRLSGGTVSTRLFPFANSVVFLTSIVFIIILFFFLFTLLTLSVVVVMFKIIYLEFYQLFNQTVQIMWGPFICSSLQDKRWERRRKWKIKRFTGAKKKKILHIYVS